MKPVAGVSEHRGIVAADGATKNQLPASTENRLKTTRQIARLMFGESPQNGYAPGIDEWADADLARELLKRLTRKVWAGRVDLAKAMNEAKRLANALGAVRPDRKLID